MSHVFGGGSQPTQQTVYVPYQAQPAAPAPAPPPNPPLFGAQQTKQKGTQSPASTFSASVLGSTPTGQPQRTLLGTA